MYWSTGFHDSRGAALYDDERMIYLDYNATTPVDRRVMSLMLPVFTDQFGNPSSVQHAVGQEGAELVEAARHRVAELVGVASAAVLFTSGATEAANLAIRGALGGAERRTRVLVSATEHKAVLSAAELAAASVGGRVDIVRVDRRGLPDLDHLTDILGDDVALVAVMAANNETGTTCSLAAISEIAHEAGALVMSDITQAAAKVPVGLTDEAVDLAVLSAHKMYGPKGVGALVADRQVQRRLMPVQAGGGQERGLRGGTLNTPGIVGFGAAAEIAVAELEVDARRLRDLTSLLRECLDAQLDDIELNGHSTDRLPNTLNVRFVGADAEAVMVNAPEVAVSSGSACQSAVPAPSHVLVAMGLGLEPASESVRFSLVDRRPRGRYSWQQIMSSLQSSVCGRCDDRFRRGSY
jgi:cysteine desulfurase